MKNLVLLFSAFCMAFSLQAQVLTPQPSPTSEVHQNIGLGKVELVYSRPSMKGRTIFAEDGLVPFGKIWRTGANQATKITFSEDMTFAGEPVKAGSYAMLTLPGADEWAVHLYAHETGNWASYLEKTPDVAVRVKPGKLNDQIETFTMAFQNLSLDGAELQIVWDETVVRLPIQTNVDEQVMASIDRVMDGPSAQDLYAAGSYYHATGKDLKKAHKWVKMANEKAPRYWQLRTQSLIEAELGMTEEAIATAKKSLEMATEAGNEDYIRMNTASIEEWTDKMNK